MNHSVLKTTLSTLLLVGCVPYTIHGSGDSYRTQHSLDPITSVEVYGNGEVRLQNADRNELIVFAQDNIQQHLTIRQQGTHLTIGPEKGYQFRPDDTLRYVILTNGLNTLDVSGAMEVTSDVYQTDSLHIDASGAVELDMTIDTHRFSLDGAGAFEGRLAGRTRDLVLDFAGAAELNAFDLAAEHVVIDAAGASSIRVTASDTLDVSAAGASDVRYRGRPRVSQSGSGASSVLSDD
ncbi:head GIN domain-containing protein [Reinekea blandensis]|uniref:Putative auto-transporter adhesin head GIN domain-containing protein n=1 Tax=Reinekea blandensis MED297 TaxID=314283 RepID=A4BF72_9GAMM|nr:head GIN domain-containing protein [Reinekea blandensis]EAR09185.1 hypothetical protein MED297_06878 [Reinekea sp. MED297] [Reinekea blandensis MED297]